MSEELKTTVPMKDHLIAQLKNDLRDTAVKYAGAEQLRARLGMVLWKYLDFTHPMMCQCGKNYKLPTEAMCDKCKIAELEQERPRLLACERFYLHIRDEVDEKYSVDNHVVCKLCNRTFEEITGQEE